MPFPDYMDEQSMQADPQFLGPAPGAPEPETAMQKYIKLLEEIRNKKTEESPDIQELRRQIQMGPRNTENIHQAIKDTYGFRPDTTPKRIAATAIDTLANMLGGGVARKADTEATKNYDTKLKAYEQLIGLSTKAQDESRKNQSDALLNAFKSAQLEETANKRKDTTELGYVKSDQGQQKINLQKDLNDSIIKFKDAQTMLTEGKGLEQQRALAFKLKWDRENPEVPFDLIATGHPELLKLVYAKALENNPKLIQNILNIDKDMKNAKDLPQFKVGTDPVMGVQNGQSVVTGHAPYSIPTGNVPHRQVTDTGLQGGVNQSIGDAVRQKLEGRPNPLSPEVLAPVTPQAKALGGAMTNPKLAPVTDPLQDAAQTFERSKLNTDPYADLQNQKMSKSDHSKAIKERDDWIFTSRKLQQLADNAGSALASNPNELEKQRGWWNQLPMVERFRAITGKDTSEVTQSTNALFGMANHLKTQFGSASRPSVQLINMLEHAVDDKADTPENYAKRQIAVSLLADMTAKSKTNSDFFKSIQKLDKAVENPKYSGIKGGTWAEALNQVIDETVNDAKKNHVYKRATIERVYQKALDNLKKGKGGGGAGVGNEDFDKFRMGND